jgi:hypothetical protein
MGADRVPRRQRGSIALPQEEIALGPGEVLLLALCTASLSASIGTLELLSRQGLLDEWELRRIHDRMSAALDAAEAAAPPALVAKTRATIDTAMARVLHRARSGAPS